MEKVKDKELKEFCKSLEKYSEDELKAMVYQMEDEFYGDFYSKNPQAAICYMPSGPIWICIKFLKANAKKVDRIVKEHHNDIATMVYSIGVVVGNQLILSGRVNSMTAVYTLLMYFAKVGLDKFLADTKNSPDDTSDEGKGDVK